MKVFTVHEPPDAVSASPDRGRLDRITFVKEGFCWPALFVPMFWLLWHRMWWVLLAWLAAGVSLAAIGNQMPETDLIIGVVSLLFGLWFALEANALRRWSLSRKGWRMLGVAAGRDREEAEQSFFRRHLAPGREVPRPAAPVRTVPPRPRPPANEPVIGLFPQPE
jgi:hypothetical protein